MEIAFASITELQELIKNKKVTPEEVVSYYSKRFEKFDKLLGSSLEIFDKESIINSSKNQGVLQGIPGLIKDNICQKDRITSCASKMLQNFKATYDATAISRLKEVGAPLIGRANMDEFAMGSSTETSAFKKTKNPWNFDCVPGGSSGGSIAAVAAGLIPWSLGSETGGSVRQPAALCGIVGLKPTYGLISRYGLVAYASSLDQIGIATRTVKDTAHILSVIAGEDFFDSTTKKSPIQDYVAPLSGALKKDLKIGVIKNALYAEGIDPQVRKSIEDSILTLQKLGITIEYISLPSMDYGAAVYFIISRAEAASNLARFDGVRYGLRHKNAKTLLEMYSKTRQEGFGSEVKKRIMIGNYVLSVGHAGEFYNNAIKAQKIMRSEFTEVFKKYDLLLSPTAPTQAFKFGAFDDNKLQMDLQDYFTCPANITGIPAISIPCGFSKDNLPLGFQLMGPHLSEQLLLHVAHAYERETPWHTMHPPEFK